jgi:hypothetical protein
MVGGVGPSARAVTRAEVEPDHPARALPQAGSSGAGLFSGRSMLLLPQHRMGEKGSNAVASGWLAVGGATPSCVPLSTGGLLFFWFPLPLNLAGDGYHHLDRPSTTRVFT